MKKIRPTVVLGVGPSGAQVAATVDQLTRAGARATAIGDMVTSLAVLDADAQAQPSIPTTRVVQAAAQAVDVHPLHDALGIVLDTLYQVDVRQRARARGWEVAREEGAWVLMVAALGETEHLLSASRDCVLALAAQHPARQIGVAAILLCDPECDAELQVPGIAESCTEGCYVLTPLNIYGMALADTQAWITMMAQWILEIVTTPLGLHLSALPAARASGVASFGLARWHFPAHALAGYYADRLRGELLDALLGWVDDVPTIPAFVAQVRARCVAPPLFGEHNGALEATVPTWPALHHVANLKTELDAVRTAATARVNADLETWDTRMDAALHEAADSLDAMSAEVLDSGEAGRLTVLGQALEAAARAFDQAARQADAQRQTWDTQKAAQATVLQAEGEALAVSLADFPAWTWSTWWPVLCRPWRWPQVFRQYRDIVHQATVYRDKQAALYLLDRRAREAAWRIEYAVGLAAYAREQQARLHDLGQTLRAAQEAARANTARANTPCVLEDRLAAAALPAQLLSYFYHQGRGSLTGEFAAFAAHYGPLSRWVLGDQGALGLLDALAEHAREHFDFLEAIRLDELLVHTYSGTELRARLAELLEAAAPFWTWTLDALPVKGQGQTHQQAWLGLPCADDAPLVDVLPERGATPYSTGDVSTITAVQILMGIEIGEEEQGEMHEALETMER